MGVRLSLAEETDCSHCSLRLSGCQWWNGMKWNEMECVDSVAGCGPAVPDLPVLTYHRAVAPTKPWRAMFIFS